MNAQTNISKEGRSPPQGVSKARISAKTRKAIEVMVKTGCNQGQAAAIVGMNQSALSRALNKPHTKDALEAALMQYTQDIMARKTHYTALALERVRDIALNSKDERNSLRAYELLTGASKSGPSVSVTVNSGGGYEFAPPGARIVEIEGSATDMQSGDQGSESPMIADDAGDCEE